MRHIRAWRIAALVAVASLGLTALPALSADIASSVDAASLLKTFRPARWPAAIARARFRRDSGPTG